MKIIKQGNVISQRMVCSHCSCEFEYDNGDIQIDYGIMGTNSYVTCPCCHQRINIYNYGTWQWPYPYNAPIVTYKEGGQNNGNG